MVQNPHQIVSGTDVVEQVRPLISQALNTYSTMNADMSQASWIHGVQIASVVTGIVLDVLAPNHPAVFAADVLFHGVQSAVQRRMQGQ